MARTLGLSHLALAVRDPQRALDFYAKAFGVRECHRTADEIQALGPGPHDVLAFVRDVANAGKAGGIAHFGFRLERPEDIDAAVLDALVAGGTLLRRGEFGPGLPYAYVADPDGYEIELWYERPAPLAEPPVAAAAPTPVRVDARSSATRVRLDAGVYAHRCLRRLPAYAAEPRRADGAGGALGALVGRYRNPDGAPVDIHEHGLRWQGSAQRLEVAYADIVGIERPGGATTETLTLVLHDGVALSLPVRGRDGRFCDSEAMLRFLDRVRARRNADAAMAKA